MTSDPPEGFFEETLDLLRWDCETWDADPPPGWDAEQQRFIVDEP